MDLGVSEEAIYSGFIRLDIIDKPDIIKYPVQY